MTRLAGFLLIAVFATSPALAESPVEEHQRKWNTFREQAAQPSQPDPAPRQTGSTAAGAAVGEQGTSQ